MTSTPVTSMTTFFSNAANTSATNSNKSDELTKSFTQVMGTAANTQNTVAQPYQNTKNDASVNKNKSQNQNQNVDKGTDIREEKDAVTNQTNENKATESEQLKNTKTEVSDEMKQELADKANKLVSEVAKKLDVSEDEIRATMEMMGIQAVDLLNPDSMAQLIVTLSGETDMMSLVMDEDLYGILTELTESAENIMQALEEQFQITPEKLSQVMDELKAETIINDLKNVMPQEKAEELQQNSVMTDGTKATEEPIVIVEKEVVVLNKVPEQNEVTEQNKNTTNTEEFTETEVTTEKPLETNVQHSDSQSENGQNTHTQSGQTFLQGLVEQAAKIAENVVGNETEMSFASTLGTQDTESIMKQMMNYMKLHVNQNVTEMEMQLHPASLGTVNLQIASQNGAITARFSVQNEGVKEALESQIVQLKENLVERGIKVDEVEVTIASHEFERNLEQGGNQEAQDSERTEAAKKANRRKLVLDEMGDNSEELDESDRIQVALMQQNGNTVNYMA